MNRRKKPAWVENLTKERILTLLDLAKKNPDRARRYFALAKKLSSKYNIPLSSVMKNWKKKICKHCGTFWTAKNVKIRAEKKVMVYRCLECGKTARFGYAVKRSE
jgi:RNase P subunit RPR2